MSFHEVLLFAVFILAIALVLYRDRKRIVFAGFAFIRRTERGKKFLDSTSKAHPKFWKAFGIASIATGIPAMVFISYYIVNNVLQIALGQVAGAVSIVLPYTTFEQRPGVLFVPWYFWVLGIATVVIPHELSHGIMCRLNRIKVDNLGWFLLLFIPGAFVEPNKRSLKRASRKAKLAVYSAGSFANLTAALLFAFLGFLMVAFAFSQLGIYPAGVIADTPAANANLSGAIVGINNVPINSLEDLQNVLTDIPPYSPAVVMTTTGNFSLVTAQHPEFNRSYIGVAGPYQPYYVSKIPAADGALQFIFTLLGWLFTINLGIGLFNLLPIKPLDGGLLFEELLSRFTKRAKPVTKAVSIVLGLMVIFAIIGPALLAI
jgi:membrane-associated protease RseP (regulator of RpoE activity)